MLIHSLQQVTIFDLFDNSLVAQYAKIHTVDIILILIMHYGFILGFEQAAGCVLFE